MKRSVQRKHGVKLWRPGVEGNESESAPERHKMTEGELQTAQEAAPDDLDALLDMYSQQARDETSALEELLRKQQVPKGRQARVVAQEAALATPLNEANKGFQLLSKMGYKAGVGLGREEQGMVQPISIQMRTARAGLGVDEQKKERQQKTAELELQRAAKRARHLEQQREEYRDVVKASFQVRSMQKQLRAAVRVAGDLDEQAGVESNVLLERISRQLAAEDKKGETGEGKGQEEEEDGLEDEESSSVEDMLDSLLQYLRTEHCYCMYCGCKYYGAEDLAENCPGLYEDDH